MGEKNHINPQEVYVMKTKAQQKAKPYAYLWDMHHVV